MNELKIRQEIIEYGKKLVENKLIQSTWGNISQRLDEDHFLITPSGVDYYSIKEDDIVKVSIKDFSYTGKIKPSSEKKMHGLIYKKRSDVGCIIHTHSAFLQIFAACNKGLSLGQKELYHCAPYGVSGSDKLANNVAEYIKDKNGVIISNHGFVAVGENLKETLEECIKAESLAEINLRG